MRHAWREIDVLCAAGYTVPFAVTDPGADRTAGTAGTGDDQRFQTMALTAGTGQDRVFTNLGERDDADFQNVEFAINRRFANKWIYARTISVTMPVDATAHVMGRT